MRPAPYNEPASRGSRGPSPPTASPTRRRLLGVHTATTGRRHKLSLKKSRRQRKNQRTAGASLRTSPSLAADAPWRTPPISTARHRSCGEKPHSRASVVWRSSHATSGDDSKRDTTPRVGPDGTSTVRGATRRRAGNPGRTAGACGFWKGTYGTANPTASRLDSHRRPAAYAFTLIAGHPPFEIPTLKETHIGIKKNERHVPSNVRSPARNLIQRMLQQEPEKRPNIEAIMPQEFKTYARRPGENKQTRSTSSWPQFRPTSKRSRFALRPLGNFEAFLKEQRSFCDATRKYHQGVVAASGADDPKNRQRNCFEARTRAGWPEWESSVMAEPAALETDLNKKRAIGRRRVVTNDKPSTVPPP
ncbi:hypothetical protein HPB49_007961 [Dermacentor silvarum]|uniref:Uncharacterized protein n=1 Tax=Dermacentor silvarum TaxID=543639 RepID=A0ACB8DYA2_DERSI|nr:hypothetical protein HPB49_007961 [Dermacentor silvarum]